MTTFKWLMRKAVLSMHDRQLAEHGGGQGVRDEGLLDSALQRPMSKCDYGEPDIAELATAYAFGIARNHPFIDGNKRTALVAARTFLYVNNYTMTASNEEKLTTFLALASGAITEENLAIWFRKYIQPLSE
jgi:death on curing protein